jgi:hypothetical protein
MQATPEHAEWRAECDRRLAKTMRALEAEAAARQGT